MSVTPESRLFGSEDDLYTVGFARGDLASAVAPIYTDLLEELDPNDVLVLKRFPTGIETFMARLTASSDAVGRPNVESLTGHAESVVTRGNQSIDVLKDVERLQLVRTFLEKWDWSHEYLRNAARKPSFRRDVGRLMVILAWQGGPNGPVEDDRLAEIVDASESFRAWLADHGYLERGRVVSTATELLSEDGTLTSRIQRSFDAVLAVEFEEFAAVDRAYLHQLTNGVRLVAVAETDSSIQRVWNEPGDVEALANEHPTPAVDTTTTPLTKPAVVSNYLATGSVETAPTEGDVTVLAEATFEEQLREVADEIERLRRDHDWKYDDFAVGFRSSQAPIEDAVRLLQQAGIPTASVTVTGFGDDPMVREAYRLGKYRRDGDTSELDQLNRMLPEGYGLEANDIDGAGVEETLWQWIHTTEVKHRIASDESPLEARAQFDNLADVLALASFLEASDILDATWEMFLTGLEELFAYAATDIRTADIDVKDDGVLVDAVRVMKNATWKATFMVNVVEREYPSTPELTALFPDSQLRRMDAYPGVTTPSSADVRGTFATAAGTIGDPYRTYYEELSRRLLAVGARSAEERLYFGLYGEERGGSGARVQPSRFLVDLVERFPWIEDYERTGIHGQAGAEHFALERLDRAERRIRHAHLLEDSVQLDEIETDLAAIQSILEAGGQRADDLRLALEARVDLLAGRVRR